MSKTTKIVIGVVVLAVIGIVVGILVTRPKGDFNFDKTSYTLAVPIGRQGTLDITLIPPTGKNFPKGDITFSIKETSLPAGVKQPVFNPAKITAKGDEKSLKTTLTVSVDNTAKETTTTLTLVAKGGGVTKEAKLSLTIQKAPDYSLEVSPATVTVKQGASATVTVNIKRNETMKDPVTLSVTGAPSGVKVTVDPSPVPADKPSATLKIEVPATGVDAKDYTLTITGKATGIADKTATLKLTVQEVSFRLEAVPSVVTIKPGESAQVAISIVRTNLTDPVKFTAKNLPAGLSATFNPESATGDKTTLTISAAADAAPGSYSFTVEGAAAGKTQTITVKVDISG